MVEICVAVADPIDADGLMRGLAELFGRSSVSFDHPRSEVRIRSEWESRAVMEVIDVVDRWLAADGIASATLSIGDRSHTLIGPAQPAPTHTRAA
jgi:hypothetical protein